MASDPAKTQENVTDSTYETSSEEDGLYQFRRRVSEFFQNRVLSLLYFFIPVFVIR